MTDLQEKLLPNLSEAEDKAWKSLAGYKFQMFGYWAAIWVHLNRIGDFNHPNPFRILVVEAQGEVATLAVAEPCRVAVRIASVREQPKRRTK